MRSGEIGGSAALFCLEELELRPPDCEDDAEGAWEVVSSWRREIRAPLASVAKPHSVDIVIWCLRRRLWSTNKFTTVATRSCYGPTRYNKCKISKDLSYGMDDVFVAGI